MPSNRRTSTPSSASSSAATRLMVLSPLLPPCVPAPPAASRPPPRPTRRGAQRGKRERAERAGQPGAPPARTRHAWLAGALCDRAARNRTAQATNLQWRRGSGWRPWGQRPSTRTPVGTAWYRGPGCVAETICAAVAAPRGRASPVQLAPQAVCVCVCVCVCVSARARAYVCIRKHTDI